MRRYELMLVLHPEVDEERREAVMAHVRRAAEGSGGEVVEPEDDRWGRRKLAFKMGPHTEAYYHLAQLTMEASAAGELEGALNISEDVLRHLLVREEEQPAAVA